MFRFAGRRREGDVQYVLELADFEGHTPAVVLCDVVYGEARNLLDPNVLGGIMRGVITGHIIGFRAGLPCDT